MEGVNALEINQINLDFFLLFLQFCICEPLSKKFEVITSIYISRSYNFQNIVNFIKIILNLF